MAIDVRKTGDAEYGRFLNVLFCGDPGAGKTLISSTFPHPFYASAEGGLMSVADRGIPYTEIRATDELLALKEILDTPPDKREQYLGYKVETVVIDTIDQVALLLAQERMKTNKKEVLAIQDWGWLGDQMRGIIMGFRNLELHTVFTCHLRTTEDSESGRAITKPAIPGAVGEQVPAMVDLALLLKAAPVTVIEDGTTVRKIVRTLQSYPDPMHPWVKDRSGRLPQELDVNFQDDYQRINDIIFGHIDERELIRMRIPADRTGLPESASPESSAVMGATAAPPAGQVVNESSATEELLPVDSPGTEQGTSEPAPPGVDPETGEIKHESADELTAGDAETVEENVETTPANSAGSVEETKFTCADCGAIFDSEDQADLSKIRFRKVLCSACFRGQGKK